MQKRVAILQGHPDPKGGHYGHALAEVYGRAAEQSGHEVQFIQVARLQFPWLRTQEDFNSGAVPPGIVEAQRILTWASHWMIVFPLWHGTMPSLLKAFIEQTFRPGFALEYYEPGRAPRPLLKGRSARVVVTMGMPAPFYRWYFHAHGVRSFEQSILRWSGIRPVRAVLIGNIDARPEHRRRWLERMRSFGARAS